MNIIFHIDMNSYFASVEQQANPHLRGRPVGVCEHLGGIVIAPSIEAKRHGVKTAMPVWEAQKICPDITLLPVDPPKYRHISQRLWRLFAEYTEYVERASIDEAFLNVTALIGASESHPWSAALLYALEIKHRIRQEIGQWLTCSIGIASNRLLAKIAANRDKPDGLTVINPEAVEALADQLRLRDIPGIGPRLVLRLAEMGIYSIADLRSYDMAVLYEHFGLLAWRLRAFAFFSESELGIHEAGDKVVKSLGHAYTLPAPTSNIALVRRLIFKLAEKVARRLRKLHLSGSVASIFVRSAFGREGKTSFQKAKNLKTPITDGRLLFAAVYQMFKQQAEVFPVRMVTVSIAGLSQQSSDNALFERYRRQDRAVEAQDKVNDKHGEFTLLRAGMAEAKNLAGDTLGFGRIRELSF